MNTLATLDKSNAAAVTGYLEQCRTWLATCVEMTGPTEIAVAKAEIATAAEATRQLGLSKEIQLDAQEMVRRAEYALGKAIRKGQSEGTVARIGENPGPQCWTYAGLNETDEAEKFLKLNDTLTVNAMAKFKVGVQADRPLETDIDRIVRAQGLCVTSDKIEGGVRAVGTLRRVYEREGAASLAKALGIIRDAYGSAGFEAPVIDGVGYLCGRYNGELDVPNAVMRLASAHGGVNGLLNNAEVLRRQTGNPRGQHVAAAAVDLINRGRGGKKLPSWWKGDEGDASALKATG